MIIFFGLILKKRAKITGKITNVNIVATNRPPIIVVAIAPNIGSGRSGIIPNIVVKAAYVCSVWCCGGG